ncbi:MAG: TonB-dependent receptor [Proteobacteria bacterium]|nr:TonB-dependent receptor [Pseudomonadota bacterium]
MTLTPGRTALVVAAILVAASSLAAAQTPPLADEWVRGFIQSVVGGSRLPAPGRDSSRVPAQARVITAADLENSGARTLQQALATQPGIVMFDQIGNENQVTVDLRGMNATPIPTTVVLVDGVRVNEPDFGTINWHLIPIADIERIEILPGAQTVFGKNALAGVVNVVTKKGGNKTAASAAATFGSYDLQQYRADVSGPLGGSGPFSYRLAASRRTSHGFRYAEAARIHAFDGRLDYKDESTDAFFKYEVGDDATTQAGSLTASEISVDARRNVSRVENDSLLNAGTLGVRRVLGAGWSAASNVFARRRISNTPLNLGRTSISRSRAGMDSLGATLQADHAAEIFGRKSALSVGAEFGFDKIDNTSAGRFGAFAFSNSSLITEREQGVFIQETIDLVPDMLILTGGVRHDRDSITVEDRKTPANSGGRRYNRASPRVGLNVNPAQGVETFASLADSFRTPTPDEMVALGPFSSSPELHPVKGRTVEFGARAKREDLGEASVSVFRTVLHDEIFPVFDATAGFGQNTNIPKSRRQGVEVGLRPRFGEAADAFVNYTYVEATFQTAFVLDKPPFGNTQAVQAGNNFPQVPRNRVSVGVNGHPVKGLTVSADETCVGSQHVFGDESNTEPRLGGYCLLGLGSAYETGPARFFVRVDNALDRGYVTRGILATNPTTFAMDRFLIPAGGISVSGGVTLRFL